MIVHLCGRNLLLCFGKIMMRDLAEYCYALRQESEAGNIWSGGGRLLDAEKNVCAVEENTAGMQFYIDLIKKYKVSIPTVDLTEQGLDQIFSTRQIAMFPGSPWLVAQFKTIKNLNWDIVNLPKGPAGSISRFSGFVYVIPEQSKNHDLAWDLLKILVSGKIMIDNVRHNDVIPMRRSILKSPTYKEYTGTTSWNDSVFVTSLATGRIQPLIPQYDEMGSIVQQEFDRLLHSDAEVRTVARSITVRINKLLQETRR